MKKKGEDSLKHKASLLVRTVNVVVLKFWFPRLV